jgi:hypothetical protein
MFILDQSYISLTTRLHWTKFAVELKMHYIIWTGGDRGNEHHTGENHDQGRSRPLSLQDGVTAITVGVGEFTSEPLDLPLTRAPNWMLSTGILGSSTSESMHRPNGYSICMKCGDSGDPRNDSALPRKCVNESGVPKTHRDVEFLFSQFPAFHLPEQS